MDSKSEVEEGASDRVEVRRVVVKEAVEVSSAHVPGGEAIFNVGRVEDKRRRQVRVNTRGVERGVRAQG